jgi:hypothetical protein
MSQYNFNYLFIFTSPYSGSTALANLINTSKHSMFLHPKAEGCWLVDDMASKGRWSNDLKVDWNNVKKTWNSIVKETTQRVSNIRVVVEKSPSNIIRPDELLKTFPNNYSIILNRNPYANIASMYYRMHGEEGDANRQKRMHDLAYFWIYRSKYLRYIKKNYNFKCFSYEFFCEKPDVVIDDLKKNLPALSDVDINAEIKVKDYEKQNIVNYNDKQIGKLVDEDFVTINKILKEKEGLMKYWGYDYMND